MKKRQKEEALVALLVGVILNSLAFAVGGGFATLPGTGNVITAVCCFPAIAGGAFFVVKGTTKLTKVIGLATLAVPASVAGMLCL